MSRGEMYWAQYVPERGLPRDKYVLSCAHLSPFSSAASRTSLIDQVTPHQALSIQDDVPRPILPSCLGPCRRRLCQRLAEPCLHLALPVPPTHPACQGDQEVSVTPLVADLVLIIAPGRSSTLSPTSLSGTTRSPSASLPNRSTLARRLPLSSVTMPWLQAQPS